MVVSQTIIWSLSFHSGGASLFCSFRVKWASHLLTSSKPRLHQLCSAKFVISEGQPDYEAIESSLHNHWRLTATRRIGNMVHSPACASVLATWGAATTRHRTINASKYSYDRLEEYPKGSTTAVVSKMRGIWYQPTSCSYILSSTSNEWASRQNHLDQFSRPGRRASFFRSRTIQSVEFAVRACIWL